MEVKYVIELPSGSQFQGFDPDAPAENEGGSTPSVDQNRNAGSFQSDEADVLVDTWSTSRERDLYLQRRQFVMLGVGCVLLLAVLGWLLMRPEETLWRKWIGLGVLGVAVVVTVSCSTPYWASRRAFVQRKRATAAARVDWAIRRLADDSDRELPLVRFFQLNRRQLDEYQEMTKKQQKGAFFLTQAASIAAFLALVAGVVISCPGQPSKPTVCRCWAERAGYPVEFIPSWHILPSSC